MLSYTSMTSPCPFSFLSSSSCLSCLSSSHVFLCPISVPGYPPAQHPPYLQRCIFWVIISCCPLWTCLMTLYKWIWRSDVMWCCVYNGHVSKESILNENSFACRTCCENTLWHFKRRNDIPAAETPAAQLYSSLPCPSASSPCSQTQ